MERKVLTWVLVLSTLLFLAIGIASAQGVLKIDEDRSYVLNLNTGTKTCYADFLNTDQFEGDELEFRIYVSKTGVPIPDDYVLELRTNMEKPRDWKFGDEIYHSSSVVVWVGKAEHVYPIPSPIILTGVVPRPIRQVKEPGFEKYNIEGIGKGRVYVELTVGTSRDGVTLETIQQKLSPAMVFYSTDRSIQDAERAINDNLESARAKIGDTDLERDIRLLYEGGHPGWASILSKDYKELSAMVGALSTTYPSPSVTPDQLFLASGTASAQDVLKIDEHRSYVRTEEGEGITYADFLNTDQYEGDELEFHIYVSKTGVPVPDDYVLELRTNMDKPRDWKFGDDIYHYSSVVVWQGKAEHVYPIPSPIILTGAVPEPIRQVKEPGFEKYNIEGIGKGRVYVELTVGTSRDGATLETVQQKLSPSMVFYSTDRGIQAAERAINDNLGSARAKIGDTDLERDIKLLYEGGHPGWASILSKDYKVVSAMVGTSPTTPPSPAVSADTSSLSMQVGEFKDITFTVSNEGGESDTDSYLSVSVSSGLQIEEWSCSSSDMYFKYSIVGSEIVDSVGEKITSEYELLDAYEAYSAGETNTVTIKVKATASGSQWIKYRTAFDTVGSGYVFIRDPTSGPKDQQGWQVYEIPVSTGTSEEEYTFVTLWPELPQSWYFDVSAIAVDSSGNVYVADTGNHRIQKFDSYGNFITKWGNVGTGDGEFSTPKGIALDSGGNVFVADSFNHRIQKFDSYGNFITKWGNEGTGDGAFSYPYGIALDGSGNVYVADTDNNRIQKFDSNGNFITKWGSGGTTGDGEFHRPMGIAVDSNGNVFVADTINHRIQKFDSYGKFITKWGSSGTGEGKFNDPCGIAVDSSGNVFVADTSNHRIQKFDTTGKFITKWGSKGTGDGAFDWPHDLAVDNSGNVYVVDISADTLNHRIQKFDSNGNFITKWGSGGTGDGEFSYTYGLAVDSNGNVFVADTFNHRIQKFDSDGTFITKWGSSGTGEGEFDYPRGIAVDSSDYVFVADSGNDRIQKFDSYGKFITKWGSSGTGDGEFKYPEGIAVDSSGNVFVAERHRIQKFDSPGNFITKWGVVGSGNGEFYYPLGIAVDSSGNVFVADTYNNRIQKFAPGIQPIHTGYSGKIMDHETSGDTTPGDIIKGWIWVKNTGRYAKFKSSFEIKDTMGNTYYDSKTEIINSGTAHKFEGVDGLGIRIPSDAAIGEYWNSRFILYVDVGYWEEVDSTSWEPFKIKSADEPELHRDTPDEEAIRVLYGEEVSFSVNVYNANCVKWLVDNHYMDTTTDVSDGITSWRHSFYEDCTVTARAYRVEKSSEPVNWKLEITTPPPAHYPQIQGYSPSDRSLKLNPGDTVDFKVQVKDDEGDLDRVVWEVDGAERHADDVYGKIVESRFHYVAEEGAKEVKATVYDLQGNSDFISWDLEPAVIVGDGPSVSILSITPSDTTPNPGEAITLSVSTRNDGIAGTADIGMTVIDPSGDACDLQWREAEYTVGETKTLDFSYEVPSEGGGYNVISKSWDDCSGDCGTEQCCDPTACTCSGLQDGLTKPNAFDVAIPEGPDLTLTSEDISFSNFNPAVGEVITITAVIHNIGTVNANKDVIVQFFDGDPANGGIQIGDDQVIDQIAAGGAKSAQIDWTVSSITNVYVKVDPNDDIKEMKEGNNVAHRLVSIAISPEAIIDTLNELITYQNKISAYVGDNSDEMLELAFIYAIPYPLQDKEKKEQLEKKIIKNIPRLEIEQEHQKFENFYIFLDDIKEGEVITFTPDEKGTKVNVGDNSEYLVEDVYFDIPYDEITLEKEAGKISLTVEKDTEEIFSTALKIFYDDFTLFSDYGIEYGYSFNINSLDVSYNIQSFLEKSKIASVNPTGGCNVVLTAIDDDTTVTITMNDPFNSQREANGKIAVCVGVSLQAGIGVGVGAEAFASLPLKEANIRKYGEDFYNCFEEKEGNDIIYVLIPIMRDYAAGSCAYSSIPGNAIFGVGYGLSLGIGPKIEVKDVAFGIDGKGSVKASIYAPKDVLDGIPDTEKEELIEFLDNDVKFISALHQLKSDVSNKDPLELLVEGGEVSLLFWTLHEQAKELYKNEDTLKSLSFELEGGIGSDLAICPVGTSGQMSVAVESDWRVLVVPYTLDPSKFYDFIANDPNFALSIKKAEDVRGTIPITLETGITKDLYKIHVTGTDSKVSTWTSLLSTTNENNVIMVGDSFSNYGKDIDGNGLYDYLTVEFPFTVNKSGNYTVTGLLYKNSTCISVAKKSSYLSIGTHKLFLDFDGLHLYVSEMNSSYSLGYWIVGENNLSILNTSGIYDTSFYNYTEFECPTAYLYSCNDSGLDTDGDGLYDYLRVDVEINASKAQSLIVEGYIEKNGTIIYDSTQADLNPGITTVFLYFDGKEIRESGLIGSYNLTINCYTISGIEIDSDEFITNDYNFADFRNTNISLTNEYSDIGLDNDGDGLYDYLGINVRVDVKEPGSYTVDAYLTGNRTFIYTYNRTYLDIGSHNILLNFDGLTIRQGHVNQSYNLTSLRLFDDNGTIFGMRENPYVTSMFNYTEFQLPDIKLLDEYSDEGVDVNNNGLYDYLSVGVQLDINKEGYYIVAGYLNCNNSVIYAENTSLLEEGEHFVKLNFDGESIYRIGANCSYQVEGVGIILNGKYIDYMDMTYNTSIYNYTDFETGEVPSVDLPISTAEDSQLRPSIAYNSVNNEYLVSWDDKRGGSEREIYAQRLSGANNLVGSKFAIALSSGTDINELNPFVVYNPTANEYLVVWNEKYGYHKLYYIYAQRVTNTGSLVGDKITVSSGGVRERKLHPSVAYNPANSEYLVVWYGQDVERQSYRIYGQRLSGSGSLLGSNFAIGDDIGKDNYQYYPQVAYNSHSNDYLVVWEDMRNGVEKDIYAQKVSGSGDLFGSNYCICNATNAQEAPYVAYNSADNQYLVTWQDARTGSNADIYAQMISGTGNLLGNEIAVRVGRGTSRNPSVTYNSKSNVYFVAWEEDDDIFAQVMSNDGALSESSVVICDAASNQGEASVAYNLANNQYFITWQDYRNGNYDIYGAWVGQV